MKALKQEEPKIPREDSKWLSKNSHPGRSDKKDSANCLTQESVGLKKKLNEYTCSDIPQLCEEITEKYSDLLGPHPLKLPVRGQPVFCSKNISEFIQLRPWTPSAFFGLQPPLSSGDTLEYFLFQVPSSSPQHYCMLLPLWPLIQHPLQRLLWDLCLLWR